MRRIRLLGEILRNAGFGPISLLFVAVFLLCSTAVWLSEPDTNTFADGMWFSFEVVSTIGFGDVEAGGPIARIVTVLLSIVSIFYLALITGIVVSYCNEAIHRRQNEELSKLLDKMESLESLPKDELATISAQVRKFRK